MHTFLPRQQAKRRSLHRGNAVLHSRIFLSVLALIALITCLALSQKARTVKAESKDSAGAEQTLRKKAVCRQDYLRLKYDLSFVSWRPAPPHAVSLFPDIFKLAKSTPYSLLFRPTPLGIQDSPGEEYGDPGGGTQGCTDPCRQQKLTCGQYWLWNVNGDGCTFICTTGPNGTGIPSLPYMCEHLPG